MLRKTKKVLRDLERAYISSRYLYEEFFEEEVENAIKGCWRFRTNFMERIKYFEKRKEIAKEIKELVNKILPAKVYVFWLCC